MSEQVQSIPLAWLRRDGGTQMRVEISREFIDGLIEAFGDGEPAWPVSMPPVVAFYDAKDYWLADGHHRGMAAEEAGLVRVPAIVHQGSQKDAQLYACGANKAHGLRRSNEDKRAAVTRCYELEPTWSDGLIAEHCGVSQALVSYTLKPIRATQKVFESTKRVGKDGRTYDVSRVGKKKDPAPAPTAPAADSPVSAPPEATDTPPVDARPTPPAEPVTPPAEQGGGWDDWEPSPRASTSPEAPAFLPGIEEPPAAKQPAQWDELGIVCTDPRAVQAFDSLPDWDEVEDLIRQLARKVNKLAQQPGTELYRLRHLKLEKRDGKDHYHSADLANALRELRHWRPYCSVCPWCHAVKKTNCSSCQVCHGLPYVTKDQLSRAPEDLRKAVEALAPKEVSAR